MPDAIIIDDLTRAFGERVAVSHVSFRVGTGEIFGLLGPNGSGKTTLINCISGALRNDGGTIRFRGRDITSLAAHQRTRLGIARSFQIPRPFTSMTVAENLHIPLDYARQGSSKKQTAEEAMEILCSIGLDHKADMKPAELTQVEMRKLELARAMAAKPRLLISDEAMAGLSSAEVDEVLPILFRLNEQEGIAIIMIEHIMRAIMRFSERIVVLNAGETIAEGKPHEIINDKRVEKAYLGE